MSRYAQYVVAEALDVDGMSLGKSIPVQTIPAVEQARDLEYANQVTAGEVSQANDEVEAEVEAEADLDASANSDAQADANAPPDADADADADNDSETWSSKATSLVTDQVLALVIGFITCAILFAVILVVRKYSPRPWWRVQGQRYEPVPRSNQEEGEEDEKLRRDEV